MVQKIGIIAQEGTNPAFVEGTYRVVNDLIHFCGGEDKYQVFQAPNTVSFVRRIVRDGINYAILDENRYTRRGFLQINAEPIMNGMLECSGAYPDTEFVLVMRDSLYTSQTPNYFLGANHKKRSILGHLLSTTIISCGKNSPFEMEPLTFQAVLKHELGHRFCTTDHQNRKPGELYNYPQMGTHCTTPGCIMNVMNSLQEGKVAAHHRATYCPSCMAAMKKEFSR